MAGVAYEAFQQKKNQLIRKANRGSLVIAPFTADPILTLTDTADKLLKPMPTGYEDGGWLNDDGAGYARDTDTSEVTGWGSRQALRSDTTKDETTLKVSFLEAKRLTIGIYFNVDMSTVTPDPTSGEVAIERSDDAADKYWRVLGLAVDKSEYGEIYCGRFLARAKVDTYDDQTFQSSDDTPILFPVTFRGYLDAAVGFSEKIMFGGPGWAPMLADMGWTALAGG